jgi:hypothetical protein
MNGYVDDRLAFGLTLPEYVPTDQIGLNVSRLQQLTRLGGLGHFRVSSQAGDRTTYQAEITGMDASGSATAGMKVAKQEAALSSAQVDADKASSEAIDFSEYRWGAGHVIVNLTEMTDKIIGEGASLRNPRPWSKLLDKALRKGVSSAAEKQLMGDVSGWSKTWLGLLVVYSVWPQSNPHFTVGDFIAGVAMQDGICQLLPTLSMAFKGTSPKERRLSLVPAYQVDRLAVVEGMTRALKLIKPIGQHQAASSDDIF